MVATEVFNAFDLNEIESVKILAIEQDEDYLGILSTLLTTDNIQLEGVKNAQESLEKLANGDYDLIILSGSINALSDGSSLMEQIRKSTIVPIIALIEPPDEENGINLVLDGADYDLQKPFTPRRLRAAVTAVLRRSEIGGLENTEPIMPETLSSGGLALSLGRLEANVNNKKINLSAREFSLLQFLMTNPDRTFTREELAAQAWGWARGGEMRAVDSAIKRLRRKIEDDSRNPRFILTERNMGYRFNASGTSKR